MEQATAGKAPPPIATNSGGGIQILNNMNAEGHAASVGATVVPSPVPGSAQSGTALGSPGPPGKFTDPKMSANANRPEQPMSKETAKNKCKNFLSFLLELSAKHNQTVAENVKNLIQGLIDGKVNEENFADRLQKEVNSQPQPCLVGFLKISLPDLRHSLATNELKMEGIKPPPLSTFVPPAPVTALVPQLSTPPTPSERKKFAKQTPPVIPTTPTVPPNPVRIQTPPVNSASPSLPVTPVSTSSATSPSPSSTKSSKEIKNVLLEEALNERTDEEMELSDLDSSGHSNKQNGEPSRAKKMRLTGEDTAKTVHQLKEENDALRCQLEASKNEVDLIKADLRSELEMKDQQLRNLQQQFLEIQSNVSSFQSSVLTACPSSANAVKGMSPTGNYATTGSSPTMSSTLLPKQMLHSPPISVSSSSSSGFGVSPIPPRNAGDSTAAANNIKANWTKNATCATLSTCPKGNSNSSDAGTDGEDNQHEMFMGAAVDVKHGSSSGSPHHDQLIIGINEKEARLLGVISTFLHVHPFGASLDYIWSYAQKVLPAVRPYEIEVLMTKFPSLFKQEVSGIGATFERKWIFVGFS